jgi:hypothetical protein
MPPRTLTDEELETVRMTEAAVDRRPAAVKASETHLKPQEGQVKLYCPDHRACSFGPGNSTAGTTHDLIQFGEVEDHVAIVPSDHPLLDLLRRQKPGVVVLEPGEEYGKVYSCERCDQEFPSKRALTQHRKAAHARKAQDQAKDSSED